MRLTEGGNEQLPIWTRDRFVTYRTKVNNMGSMEQAPRDRPGTPGGRRRTRL